MHVEKKTERVQPPPKRILDPDLMDRGVGPIFVPQHSGNFLTRVEQWQNTFREEAFFAAVWREFRQQTSRWPWFAMLWHYGALMILLACLVGALVAGINGIWLVTIWLLPLGVFVYVMMRLREDAVLLAEWRRHRRRDAAT